MRLLRGAALGLMLATPTLSWAFAPPAHLEGEHRLSLKTREALRKERATTWIAPVRAQAAWARFEGRYGKGWRALWDAHTGVPLRIFGPGIEVPGALNDPGAAEKVALELLAQHLDLLAPGAEVSDFELVSNDFDSRSGTRSLGFVQRYRGLTVRGAQLSVRIKKDRVFVIGSEAVSVPNLAVPAVLVSNATARKVAQQWVAEHALAKTRPDVGPAEVLPLITEAGQLKARIVREVIVDAESPVGRWSVFVDAGTGELVAREQTLRFASGSIQFNTPERRPGSTRLEFPARDLQITLNGQRALTDADGNISFEGQSANVTLGVSGPRVTVSNQGGAAASVSVVLEDGQTFAWDERGQEQVDAQLVTFIHASLANAKGREIAPDMRWLQNEAVPANVNINDSCNAYSDGTSINFFRASRQCENTARLPDVIHHEFGHSFHAHAVIRGVGQFDTSLSEGASDYLAATMSGDPGMGRGFFFTNAPLRHIDPQGEEARWPDDIAGDPHTTGLIFGGAMWDLRKGLIRAFGDEASAVSHTDQIWYQILRRASDIPTTYIEALAADDDDGNLQNGTPNACIINEAFALHGLADPGQVGPPLGVPQIDDNTVIIPVLGTGNDCPGSQVATAKVVWRLRGADAGGEVPLALNIDSYTAVIPPQVPGSVVQYQVQIQTDGGDTLVYPDNRADPWYEMFVGEVVPIYCTDFESNPLEQGWSSELLAGQEREGANDWAWGPPQAGPTSGDPLAPYSGASVFGNDLGGGNYNGLYQPSIANIARTPVIDVGGYTNVRLQYRRWLSVEDADYDQAQILSNDQLVWQNYATGGNGTTAHQDREWRFQDVDLSRSIANGQVQLSFVIRSDRGAEFGGWTIDDLCVVAYQAPVCGDGNVDPGETCDDGNQDNNDGCEANCTPTLAACGNGRVEPGEACDDGNQADGDGCQASCVLTPDPMNPIPTDPMLEPEGTRLINDEGGCGCSTTGAPMTAPLGLLLLGVLALRRRR